MVELPCSAGGAQAGRARFHTFSVVNQPPRRRRRGGCPADLAARFGRSAAQVACTPGSHCLVTARDAVARGSRQDFGRCVLEGSRGQGVGWVGDEVL